MLYSPQSLFSKSSVTTQRQIILGKEAFVIFLRKKEKKQLKDLKSKGLL